MRDQSENLGPAFIQELGLRWDDIVSRSINVFSSSYAYDSQSHTPDTGGVGEMTSTTPTQNHKADQERSICSSLSSPSATSIIPSPIFRHTVTFPKSSRQHSFDQPSNQF